MTTITSVPLERPKSDQIFRKACQISPGGVHSPVRSFPGLAQTPLVVESGRGDKVVDVDGFTYIDYCCSWGALIHGHAEPRIVEAASRRMFMGSSFGITTPIESELASLIVKILPHVEKVRFVSSGTEATMTAMRVARGFTGRDKIIKFAGNYHGHCDALLVQAGSGLVHLTPSSSSAGVPKEFVQHTLCLPYNDLKICQGILQKEGKKIAAVILEPIACNMGVVVPSHDFLYMLREETAKTGTLLIFDEIITGFRVGLKGASAYFGITPDLSCFGKIIGGGFPAAAFGGRKEIMDVLAPLGPVYQAGTLSGNPVAMEAGYQAVSLCCQKGFYEDLQEKADLLLQPIQECIEEKQLNVCLQTIGSLFTLFFGKKKVRNLQEAKECDVASYSRFFQHLFQKGIYLAPAQFEANFISAAHSKESLLYTRDCILEALLA